MNLAIVTSIAPNKKNTGGPSGLIWEIQELLKQKSDINIDTFIVNSSKNKYIAQLNTWGIYQGKYKNSLEKYDKILLYPDFLLGYMPSNILEKIIVLAPDASSMVGKRKYDVYMKDESINIVKKVYQYLYYKRFVFFEKKYIPKVNKYIVVGENDRDWLQSYLKINSDKEKVVFLRHPLLSYSMVDLEKIEVSNDKNKRFIFAGDMRYSYVGQNIKNLAENLNRLLEKNDDKLSIVVVGKANKWIADIFSQVRYLNVEYFTWIEHYQDICQINRDVHCIPLIAGGGTKNRVLTAIANGLEIISTKIGTENIPIKGLTNVFICENMNEFANKMIKQSNYYLTEENSKILIKERLIFRKNITKEFHILLNSFIK
ncbi:glycosyltransferase [Megamonas rupellensis]|jgi:hypothetical protein|uniref:glycosyltransferase n=1 Tax=Megamonas rupellensis TaxID=491921 RepID=UPI00037C75A5|nr:glycosyltransferase [Megamonas rupellensis]